MSSPAALFLSAFAGSPPRSRDDEETIAGYTLGPVVGYGATSTIRKAYNAADRDAHSITAVKIIRIADLVRNPAQSNNPKALARVRRSLAHEESIWASLSHEHVLPLFMADHTPDAFYFFTLYCPAGSLFDILKRDGTPALLQDDAGMMFRQVVRGLRYLHEEAGLVHRDIKLENVLVDEMGLCKIADFGTAKPISRRFYQRSRPASRSQSRTRPEPDLDTASSLSSSSDEDQGSFPSISVQRASSLTAPRPFTHQNRFHRNSHSHYHSQTLPPSSSSYTDAIFRNHNNPKLKAKSKHRFQPGSLPYAAPELLLPYPPATVSTTTTIPPVVQILGHPHGHRAKSRSRSKSANRNNYNGNSTSRSKSRSRPSLPKKSSNHSQNYHQNRHHHQPHPGQDIWALGVLLYALLTGNLPFADRFEPRLHMKILNGHFTPPPDIGRGAERILYGCLDKNLSTRWTIAMVDEVAWGVGWGREGDIGGSDEEEEEDLAATSGVPLPTRPAHTPAEHLGRSTTETKRNGANASLYNDTSRHHHHHTGVNNVHPAVTLVDEHRGLGSGSDFYALDDDDDNDEEDREEYERGRKGIPVPVPR